jgi:hypothetical protein
MTSKQSTTKCTVCSSLPHISCCGKLYCLVHAHGSLHAQHTSHWQNTPHHATSLPLFNKRHDAIISALEAELDDLEQKASFEKATNIIEQSSSKLLKVTPALSVSSSTAIFAAPFAKSRNNPSGGLTFAELKQRTKLEAAKKKNADIQSRSVDGSRQVLQPKSMPIPNEKVITIDEYEDDVDGTARSQSSMKSSVWTHDFKTKKKKITIDQQSFKIKLLEEITNSNDNLDTTATESISETVSETVSESATTESVESISVVRNAVLRAIIEALRHGSRLDVVAAAAIGVDTSSEIVYRAALERAESMLPKAAALSLISRGIEGALYSSMDVNTVADSSISSSSSSIEKQSQDPRTGQLYRARARELITALKNADNKLLRTSILSGQMPPSNFVRLSTLDLAGPMHREEINRLKQVAVRDATIEGDGKGAYGPAASQSISCPNCNSKYNIQSRNVSIAKDIRKAEIWGTSTEETMFGYLCTSCRHTWMSSSEC